MTYYRPNPDTIREEIYSLAKNDNQGPIFLTDFYGSTLDGSDVAAYMESIGFEVEDYHDTGTCGLTTLTNGVQISTNGCALRKQSHWKVEISVDGSPFPVTYDVMARTRHSAECEAINKAMQDHGVMPEYKFVGTYEV